MKRCPAFAALSRAASEGSPAEVLDHARGCSACGETLRRIRALGEAARALPVRPPGPEAVRALEARVLAAARARRPARRRPLPVAIAAAAAVALLAIGAAVLQPREEIHRGRIVAAGDARYRHDAVHAADGGRAEVVELAAGRVTVEVARLRAGERFVVRTEDAEVEVRGTAFEVEARDGGLARVAVLHGRVEVRFGNAAPVLLGPGERWTRPAAPAAGRAPGALAAGGDAAAPADDAASAAPGDAPAPGAVAAAGSSNGSGTRSDGLPAQAPAAAGRAARARDAAAEAAHPLPGGRVARAAMPAAVAEAIPRPPAQGGAGPKTSRAHAAPAEATGPRAGAEAARAAAADAREPFGASRRTVGPDPRAGGAIDDPQPAPARIEVALAETGTGDPRAAAAPAPGRAPPRSEERASAPAPGGAPPQADEGTSAPAPGGAPPQAEEGATWPAPDGGRQRPIAAVDARAAERAWTDAWEALRAGDTAAAAAGFERAAATAGDPALARDAAYWRIVALGRGGDPAAEAAMEAFLAAHPEAERAGEVRLMLGVRRLAAGRAEAARPLLEQAARDAAPGVRARALEALERLRR